MPATYENIATTTLSSDQTTVTFSSISGNFTDIVLVANCKMSADAGSDFTLRLNGDTASNYSQTVLAATASASSTRTSNQTVMYQTRTSGGKNEWFIFTANVMNYANTTTNKTVLTRTAIAGSESSANVGLWRATPQAVTSITISSVSAITFLTGSTFTLYGIKAA